MQRWEYAAVPVDGSSTRTAETTQVLNIWGSEGWELVAIKPEVGLIVCIFKRPIRG